MLTYSAHKTNGIQYQHVCAGVIHVSMHASLRVSPNSLWHHHRARKVIRFLSTKSACMSVSPHIYVYVYLYGLICLSLCLCIYLLIWPSTLTAIYPSVCLLLCQLVCPTDFLSVNPSIMLGKFSIRVRCFKGPICNFSTLKCLKTTRPIHFVELCTYPTCFQQCSNPEKSVILIKVMIFAIRLSMASCPLCAYISIVW